MKRVIALILMTISLMMTTVACSVDHNINIPSDISNISIYSREGNDEFHRYNYSTMKNKEIYEKILKLYNNSFIEKGLFVNSKEKPYIDNTNAKSNLLTGVINENLDYIYVKFQYNTIQTLMLNDEIYYKSNGDTVSYKELLLEVKDEPAYTQIRVYVINYSSTVVTSVMSSSYQFVSYGNQYALYTYLNDLMQ